MLAPGTPRRGRWRTHAGASCMGRRAAGRMPPAGALHGGHRVQVGRLCPHQAGRRQKCCLAHRASRLRHATTTEQSNFVCTRQCGRHAADQVSRCCCSAAASISCIHATRSDGARKGSQASMQRCRMPALVRANTCADALPLLPCAGVLADWKGPWLRRPQQVRRQGSTAAAVSVGAKLQMSDKKRLGPCQSPTREQSSDCPTCRTIGVDTHALTPGGCFKFP